MLRTALPTDASPRSVVAVLTVLLLVSSAGCAGIMSDGGGAGAAKLDSVPATADSVAFVDVDGLLGDDTIRSLANTYLSQQAEMYGEHYSGPASVDEMLSGFENRTGVSASAFTGVTTFSDADAQADSQAGEYNGLVVTSTLSKSELETALRNGTPYSVSTETYKGRTLWISQGSAVGGTNDVVGWLGDGTFVAGTRAAVEDVVDVRAGDADALGGELRQTFEDTRNGYVTFAMSVPQDQISPGQYGGSSELPFEALNSVHTISGAFYAENGDVGLVTHVATNSSSAADDVANVVEGVVSIYSSIASDEVASVTLDEVTVTSEGTTVTVSYEHAGSAIEDAIESLYNTSSTSSVAAVPLT